MEVGRIQCLALKRVGGKAACRNIHPVEKGRQLFALEMVGWSVTTEPIDRFWRGLRWGGVGISLALLLNLGLD